VFISFFFPFIPLFTIRHMQADPEETGPGSTSAEVAAVDLGAASAVGAKASCKVAGKGSRGARGKRGGGAWTPAAGNQSGSSSCNCWPRKKGIRRWLKHVTSVRSDRSYVRWQF
jgi:hypothetical protein